MNKDKNNTIHYFLLKVVFAPFDWLLQWPDKKNNSLEGVYAPVDHEFSQECEVVGELPEAMNGEFARNGPNPRFRPSGGYHWFDGDGMIHGVRITAGSKAMYTNRYVRTKKLAVEEEAGKPVKMKLGDFCSRLALAKIWLHSLKNKLGVIPDLTAELESTANTSLVYHAGRLMALEESALPYALRVMCDGVIETMGKATFEGDMKNPFTAHPKKDPATGKLYAFGYQVEKPPYVTFYVLDVDGKLERQFPVDVPRAIMMHDFHITENYAIFMDLPLLFNKERVLSGDIPFVFDKSQGARMGVLPLDATDASGMRWFDLPEVFFAFHVLNAWEEQVEAKSPAGGAAPSYHSTVKIITSDIFEFDFNFTEVGRGLTDDERRDPHVTTLNLDTGEASRAKLLPRPMTEGYDFPQVRHSLLGRKARFGYYAGFDGKDYPNAVVKVDLQAATPEEIVVGRIDLGDSVGGEALFIPSKPNDDVLAGVGEEDDGYLATFVSPRDGSNSELRVWNAKTMNPEPVATVKLPGRVPLGFHAIFISEADLAKQRGK